jgi:SAM-dependent methyltransferase
VTSAIWAQAEAYDPYIGRWSRLVAREFLRWLRPARDAAWLDVGCGTGALSMVILEDVGVRRLVGIDPSTAYVEQARKRIGDPSAKFEVGDALNLPYKDAAFGYVASGLVLNFVERPQVAVSEMRRVARRGGTVAAYVWDYAGRMELMRWFWDAAVALDPTAAELDEGRRFPIAHPTALATLFRDVGLRAVDTLAIEVPTIFSDFDDYWSPFLGGQGPAPSYAMSLDDEHRDRLRERLRDSLPRARDGSISLVARAWAVRGTV